MTEDELGHSSMEQNNIFILRILNIRTKYNKIKCLRTTREIYESVSECERTTREIYERV